ncbi:FeoC-like transcriptional regulator [Methylocystis borbori]|uniref:FeoC-like transcriptional regulator n=1 Tax=Methylocystis borbori TaxID=3118750 RepID=UPI0038CC04ED
MATLSSVRSFMESRHRASVLEIAASLRTTPDVARNLLEIWRAKNKVRRIVGVCAACGKAGTAGCGCAESVDISDIYEWVEERRENRGDS